TNLSQNIEFLLELCSSRRLLLLRLTQSTFRLCKPALPSLLVVCFLLQHTPNLSLSMSSGLQQFILHLLYLLLQLRNLLLVVFFPPRCILLLVFKLLVLGFCSNGSLFMTLNLAGLWAERRL
ncbi:hypothetical protein B0H14DRAFT_2960898, partial [Mycena olivaceomarginata]